MSIAELNRLIAVEEQLASLAKQLESLLALSNAVFSLQTRFEHLKRRVEKGGGGLGAGPTLADGGSDALCQ